MTTPAKAKRPGLPIRYRLKIARLTVLAVIGGYAVAAAAAAAISLWLPALGWMTRAEAVMTGTMLAFLIHAVLAIGVFSARSERRAWATVIVPGLVLGLGLILTGGQGRGQGAIPPPGQPTSQPTAQPTAQPAIQPAPPAPAPQAPALQAPATTAAPPGPTTLASPFTGVDA